MHHESNSMKDSISGYDIIGDIHGHAKELKALLKKMGCLLKGDVWTHPERKAIFVGDYIDRGLEIRETLNIVKSMVDAGQAFAIMGNHEYNALAFNYENPCGGHIRKHTHKNIHQHYETLIQFKKHESEWSDYLSWFSTLPYFLELDGVRFIHACWDDNHIEYLRKLDGALTKELLLKSHDKKKYRKTWTVFDEALKGKEIPLPEGYSFEDHEGTRRTKCRSKWWLNTEGLTMQECLFHAPENLNSMRFPPEQCSPGYDKGAPLVFFGHYWLNHNIPHMQAPNVCCLDYGVAKKGQLVAYRYYADEDLAYKNQFVSVKAEES